MMSTDDAMPSKPRRINGLLIEQDELLGRLEKILDQMEARVGDIRLVGPRDVADQTSVSPSPSMSVLAARLSDHNIRLLAYIHRIEETIEQLEV